MYTHSKHKLMQNYIKAAAYSLFLALVFSCNDPTFVGEELLEQDQAEVFFTDTFGLRATTIRNDSVLTFVPPESLSAIFTEFLFGKFEDPVFGRTEAHIFAHLSLLTRNPDFVNADFSDSRD